MIRILIISMVGFNIGMYASDIASHFGGIGVVVAYCIGILMGVLIDIRIR